MRILLLLLAVSLIAAPMGAAAPAKVLETPWALRELQPEPAEAEASEEDLAFFAVLPYGDVDGDGRDEVVTWKYGNETSHLAMTSGEGLTDVLWDRSLGEHESLGWFSTDLDGDGLRDLTVHGMGVGGFEYTSHGEAGIRYTEWGFSAAMESQVLSAAAGEPVATFEDGFSHSSTGVTVSQSAAVVFVWLGAEERSVGSSFSWPFGPDDIWRIEVEEESARAFAYGTGAGYHATGADATSVLRLTHTDNTGTDGVSLEFGDAQTEALGVVFVEATQDKATDVLVVTGPRQYEVPEAGSAGYGKETWAAYDGASGEELWSIDGQEGLASGAYRWIDGFPLADLNGDGVDEVSVIDVTVGDDWSWTIDSFILDPTTGARLLSGQDGFAFPYQDIDDDGVAEFLWIVEDESDDGDGYTLSVRSLEQEFWTRAFDSWTFPFNFDEEADTLVLSDWTGDGVGDLFMARWSADPWDEPDAEIDLVLVDGVTGAIVLEHAAGRILGIAEVKDLSGDGMPDLAVTRGYEDNETVGYYEGTNGTVEVEVLASPTLEKAWSRVVMTAGLAGNATPAYMDGFPRDAGDIDGDGTGDVHVAVWNDCWRIMDDLDGSGEDPDDPGCEDLDQQFILSGRTGKVVWAYPTTALAPLGGDVDASIPTVQAGEAFLGDPADDQGAPLPAALVVAAVALALLRRRR